MRWLAKVVLVAATVAMVVLGVNYRTDVTVRGATVIITIRPNWSEGCGDVTTDPCP